MRFRVLGPVAVAPRTPSATKVRVVLAVLLVRANETVSTESLIDELWDDSPPRTAGTTLQVYISQLRRILAEGESPPDTDRPATGAGAGAGAAALAVPTQRLLTVPPGYRLQVTDDEVDLMRFETLHQRGRAVYESGDYTGASALLREALDLWSGAALSGIPHGYTLSTAAVRLDEQRMAALEQRITADLRLGRHKELTGELMALINENPLRETLYAHLMVALFRSDRQSDALRTFTKARRALVDELGIEPGPGLRQLHERILRSDPQLIWRDQAAAGGSGAGGAVVWLPPALPDFVGREEAMAAALRTLPDASSGRPGARVLVIGGRTGVGKTTFAAELARRVARQFPHGRVFVSLRDEDGAPLGGAQAMARLAHQLETAAGTKQRPAGGEDPAERLRRTARGRRMLLILDDVASEEQVRPILAAAPDAFVVITARRALAGLDGARHLVLDVLSPKESEQLLTEIVGQRIAQEPDAALDIARLTGYLPLGLRAAGAGLTAHPHWSAAALAQRLEDDESSLDELTAGDLDVRASLAAGYQEADERQKRAFRLLALPRVPSFSLWSAAALLESTLPEAERTVDELIQCHLLEVHQPTRDKPLRYGYHRLLRALALDLLRTIPNHDNTTTNNGHDDQTESTTAAVRRLCTVTLAFVRHADSQLTPGRINYEDRYGAADGWLAARAAEVVGSSPVVWFQEECPNLVDAVRQAHAAGLWPLAWQLAESLAGYFEARAAWPQWAETHEIARDAARRAGDRAAEAEVLRSLGDLAWQQQREQEAARHFDDARALFAQCGNEAGAARALIGAADVALSAGESARAEKMYGDAMTRCNTARDERGRADAQRGLAVVELQCGRAEQALHAFTEFADAAERLGDRRWLQFAHRTKTWILELASAWSDGEEFWVPRAVEARPGIWVVGGYPD